MTRCFVLTGGPCAGKTSILDALAEKGYEVLPEAAREIIEQEVARSSTAVPWKDIELFQNLVAEKQITRECEITAPVVFLDRGLFDGKAFSLLAGVPPAEAINQVDKQRYEKVFVLEPVAYVTDESRRETPEEARRIHEVIVQIYREAGYEPEFVPVMPIPERAAYILHKSVGLESAKGEVETNDAI